MTAPIREIKLELFRHYSKDLPPDFHAFLHCICLHLGGILEVVKMYLQCSRRFLLTFTHYRPVCLQNLLAKNYSSALADTKTSSCYVTTPIFYVNAGE